MARADDLIKALQILAPHNDVPYISGADHDILYLFPQPDPVIAVKTMIAQLDPDESPEEVEEFGPTYRLAGADSCFWDPGIECWVMHV